MMPNYIYLITSVMHFASLGEKNYSFASQATILEHMSRRWSVRRSRRTLNRWLRVLEDGGFIRRIRRHKPNPDGGIIFHTTIIVFKRKAYQALAKFAGLLRKVGWKVPKWLKKRSKSLDSYRPPSKPPDSS